jgi:hypothetical protein
MTLRGREIVALRPLRSVFRLGEGVTPSLPGAIPYSTQRAAGAARVADMLVRSAVRNDGSMAREADEHGNGAGPSPEGTSAPDSGALRATALAFAGYLAYRLVFGLLRLPDATPAWILAVAGILAAAGGIGLPIVAICALLRFRWSPLRAIVAAAAGLGLWLGLAAAGGMGGGPVLGGALQDVGKILAAVGVGLALAAGIKEPNILLPAGAFAAFADFVVVTIGTVGKAMSTSRGQELIQKVSAKVPTVHPSIPALTIGPADFLFLGIFLACAARFEMGLRRTAWILAVVLAASLLLVPVVKAVPALAPMGIAFVAANWRHFRLTRQEILSTAVVLLVMGGLFVAYFLWVFPARK